jgi:uncharacterized protein DUF6515
MKRKRYALSAMLLIAVSLIFSGNLSAQPGRYRYNHGHEYAYGHSYRSYEHGYRYYPAPVRYYPSRIYYSSRPYVNILFGGMSYRYQEGYYYRPHGSTFHVVIPPFGIRVSTLPFGYHSFYVGPTAYYYYGGVFYRPHSNQYEVIAPPLGAIVNELPPGAKVTVIDGKKYYEENGTYYEESITDNNQLEYTVVGTDGVLNTDQSTNENVKSGPAVGDRFDELPGDSKPVVINGEKLYVSPSGLYYKEVIDGNRVYYEVVGS